MPRFLLASLFLFFSLFLKAQTVKPEQYISLISRDKLQAHILTLADPLLQGRECGSAGALMAARYIALLYGRYHLLPLLPNPGYYQSFACRDRIGRNVAGMLPGSSKKDEYLILSAHYDHIGKIKGVIYPGADDNASGVAVLLDIAHALSVMRDAGRGPKRNIIFVCYDAKEYSMRGSAWFAEHLHIAPSKIIANINLERMGSSLAPPGEDRRYLMAVLSPDGSEDLEMILSSNNIFYNTRLQIDYSFYGSKVFADLFFKISDQFPLSQKGVPSVLCTAGINSHTYKPDDNPQIIDYPVLESRARLIFFYIWDLANRISRINR